MFLLVSVLWELCVKHFPLNICSPRRETASEEDSWINARFLLGNWALLPAPPWVIGQHNVLECPGFEMREAKEGSVYYIKHAFAYSQNAHWSPGRWLRGCPGHQTFSVETGEVPGKMSRSSWCGFKNHVNAFCSSHSPHSSFHPIFDQVLFLCFLIKSVLFKNDYY